MQEVKKWKWLLTYFAQTFASTWSCIMLTSSFDSIVTSNLGKTGHKEFSVSLLGHFFCGIIEEILSVAHHISQPWTSGLSFPHRHQHWFCSFLGHTRSSKRIRAARFCHWKIGLATVRLCCHWHPLKRYKTLNPFSWRTSKYAECKMKHKWIKVCVSLSNIFSWLACMCQSINQSMCY